MKIAKGFAFLVYFPTLSFAVTHDSLFNEIYISPKFNLENHFDFDKAPDLGIQQKMSNSELHFKFLDFNESKTHQTMAFQIFPTYDFSRESEIEDYKNSLSICPYCIRLLQIKFSFF